MIDTLYRNHSPSTDRSRYQTPSRNWKDSSGDVFKTRISGNVVYIEQTSVGKGISWDDLEKIPGKYALKDGNSITVYYSTGNCGYKFFHAAESTDDYPVLVAKGVDEHGKYFEEKINVKQINPYNTSTLELQALAHFKPGDRTIGNPYDCMQGQEKGLQERFNFVSGAQTLINAWRRIGHAGQAAQWSDELNFLLNYTENTAGPDSNDNKYLLNVSFFEGISEESRKNMELYCNAARERLAANIAKKCEGDFMEVGFYTNNHVNTYNNRTAKSKNTYNGLDILGPSAPNDVKDAWNKAEKASGINGYGMDTGGKLTCLTELFAMSMESAYNGGGRDILGNTAYSAKTAVQKALSRMGIPQNNEEKKEKFFYESFLRFLN